VTYAPNGSIDRLRWVEERYRKRPVVTYETTRVFLSAVGLDRYLRETGVPVRDGHDWIVASARGDEPVTAKFVSDLLRNLEPVLPEHNPADQIVPWVAARVGRMEKRLDAAQRNLLYWRTRDEEGPVVRASEMYDATKAYDGVLAAVDDFNHNTSMLEGRANAISRWVDQTNPDLNRMSLDEVLEAVAVYAPSMPVEIAQGYVVYEFADGWTVQKLGPSELHDEGEYMQHCVGGDEYCNAVADDETVIWSLRDPGGRPHVTIEYNALEGSFEQIEGRQNTKPKPEYLERVQEFIRVALDGDAQGLLLAGAKPREINLRAADLHRANLDGFDFSGADLTSANLEDTHLGQTSFDGAILAGANLSHAIGRRARFNDADLSGASLTGAELSGSGFMQADLRNANLSDGNFEKTDFLEADVRGADMSHSDFQRSQFQGAKTEGANIEGALIDGTAHFVTAGTIGEPGRGGWTRRRSWRR
jgi:hypothetical protein